MMRKIIPITSFKHGILKMNPKIVLLIIISLAFVAAAVFAQQPGEAEVVAIVIRINGSLDYRSVAAEDWDAAKLKQSLFNGDRVRTGIGNKAIVVYKSGTRILINENTELEILAPGSEGKFQKQNSERTKLLVGEVFSKVRSADKVGGGYEYSVETPSSVASVRGTDFNSRYASGSATFLVISSVVEIMNQLGSVLLQQRQSTTVSEGQAPDAPKTLSQSDANKAVGWLDDVEPDWKLNIVPQGGTNQIIGASFALTVWARGGESGTIDSNASFALTSFTVSPAGLEISSDEGKTWSTTPSVTIVSGQANLMARGVAEGTVNITAEAEFCEPASQSISLAEPKQTKQINILFTDPSGGEKSLIFELEEK